MGVPRKVVQIAAAPGGKGLVLFALADDNTVWWLPPELDTLEWRPLMSLPDAEACEAKPGDVDDLPGCIYRKGHRDPQHYNRLRKWT